MEAAQPRVLIVDDLDVMRSAIRRIVERGGMQALEAEDGNQAIQLIKESPPDLMLLDVRMPLLDGYEVLCQARKLRKSLPVIMLTAFGTIADAVQCVKAGAYDYLTKPFEHSELLLKIQEALQQQRFAERGSDEEHNEPAFSLGESPKMIELQQEIDRVAPTHFSVLILGETGSGKEVVARLVHRQSQSAEKEFLALDCGAIPETLIESELFGHEKGAFTGAHRVRVGKFEAAREGTLFLDEISNLPLPIQNKLLRVLQERTYFRVGGTRPLPADARVLAASNQPLCASPEASSFRPDLYHRLSEYILEVPPLRQRDVDILLLARRFLKKANEELGKEIGEFSPSAQDLLMSYDWPGNVRELRNVVRRAALLAEECIDTYHLKHLHIKHSPLWSMGESEALEEQEEELSLKELARRSKERVERRVIARLLQKKEGNIAAVARTLQADYKTIHTKIKEYHLQDKGETYGGKRT